MLFGFLNIYKPKGMTSNSVISVLRRKLKIKQIGFSGTLDPQAEGVLPVAIGKATKLIDYLNNEKGYIATAKFGEISTTFDSEGEITKLENPPKAEEVQLKNILKNFEGKIKQKPPIYSAVHVNGKRLYEFARKNLTENDIDIPERSIFVSKISLLNFNYEKQTAEISIKCSKGTYIRSIVSDIGKALNSGAVMTNLTRTYSGGFEIETSNSPESISLENIAQYLIPVEEKLDCTLININDKEFERIKHGNSIITDIDSDKLILAKYNDITVGIGFISNNILKMKKIFI